MKRIFWFINQFYKAGGTEIVSLDLAKMLSDSYDITIVLLSNDVINHQFFDVPKSLKIKSLGIDKRIIRNEDFIDLKKPLRTIHVCTLVLHQNLYHREKYKKEILKMTTKDDILIFSSPYGYSIAPKNRKVIFHMHFNSRFFSKFSNKFYLEHFCIKPTMKLLLCEDTLKKIKLHANEKATFIYNPCRFERHKHFDVCTTPTIVFVGRYEFQKRPLLAIDMLKELYKINPSFKAEFYGCGFLYDLMVKKVKDNHLENNITISEKPVAVDTLADRNDILILTSEFEGFPLNVIEAQTFSTPVVMLDYGDGTKEVIENNKSGIIIENDDIKKMAQEVNSLLINKEKLLEFKKNAYDYSVNFSHEEIKKKWKDLLDNL